MSVTLTTNTGSSVQWDGSTIEAPTEEIVIVETAPPEPEFPDPFPEYSSSHPDDGVDTAPTSYGGGSNPDSVPVPEQTAPPEIPTEAPEPEEVKKGGKKIEPEVKRDGKLEDREGKITEKNARAKTELVWNVDTNSRPGEAKSTVKLGTQTTYQDLADKKSESGYGRGTTAEDRKNGNTTLEFHEDQHRPGPWNGTSTSNPPPQPRFTEGMNDAEIKARRRAGTPRWRPMRAPRRRPPGPRSTTSARPRRSTIARLKPARPRPRSRPLMSYTFVPLAALVALVVLAGSGRTALGAAEARSRTRQLCRPDTAEHAAAARELASLDGRIEPSGIRWACSRRKRTWSGCWRPRVLPGHRIAAWVPGRKPGAFLDWWAHGGHAWLKSYLGADAWRRLSAVVLPLDVIESLAPGDGAYPAPSAALALAMCSPASRLWGRGRAGFAGGPSSFLRARGAMPSRIA